MNTTMNNVVFTSFNERPSEGRQSRLLRHARRIITGLTLLAAGLAPIAVQAQETVCAKVKIEIKQELTLERQAFDAEMRINNTTTNGVIEDVSVVVKIMEENGTPVVFTDDPNNTSAKFFVRISGKQNISNVDGTGTVNPSTTSIINWLIIPAPGSAGANPLGKKYLVGATLKYKFGGEEQVLDVSPDVITVKPLPQLTLDYFLTQDVLADDPLTVAIEPVEPFTLGVRVRNNGFATAKNLKIDSAQPKIIENNQGLLINFQLNGSYVDDAPVQNSLLINFGDIGPERSKMGRWVMETSLAGKFTEFTARFTHADELGGALTSILQATNAHFLIRDVRVDLPGRDQVRDFLAQDGDVVRIYESDGADTIVTDRSGIAQLTAGSSAAGNATYQLEFPVTSGFIYARLPDPFNGTKPLGQVVRSDAKVMLPENVWLSKTRNADTKQWEYWINFFDVNTPGSYNAEYKAPFSEPKAPVIQFIPDRVVKEGKQVSFLVEASSPNGKVVTLSSDPLPPGATFVAQTTQAGLSTSVFDWTPSIGQKGDYTITYTATDGTLSATRSAAIKVEPAGPLSGPTPPVLVSPLGDAHVPALKPTLIVQTGTDPEEPTTQVQFEVYADSAMTQLIDSAAVNAGVTTGATGTTSFKLSKDLNEDTRYWWRARAYDGKQTYSAWMNSKFFVNLVNHPPETFNLTSPAPNIQVSSVMPVLTWTNSIDKEEDPITYSVSVYQDAALSELVTSAADLAPGTGGSTSWTVDKALANGQKYYWRVVAKDSHGASTVTPARPFTVNTNNTAPTIPTIQSPAVGGQATATTTALVILNSTDAESDLITYVFELDTVSTFDSGAKQSSGQVIQSAGHVTSWTVNGLLENKRYYWRVKAQDGLTESDWVVSNFLMNAVNDAPPAPAVKNPGNAAWVGSQQPSLEANTVLDPEGDLVQYQFEVYRDAAMTQQVAAGVSDTGAWMVATALSDKTTHYWRVRSVDALGAASSWSAPTIMYVSTGAYVDPTISVIAPATMQAPVVSGTQKVMTIRWEGTDPNIEPTVALYYSMSNNGYAGTLIVDGLKQTAGTQSGTYNWDVTAMAPGTYYIYATIYDAKGSANTYAPGALVISPATQNGTLIVSPSGPLTITEDGGSAVLSVKLGSAPTADVTVPVSSSSPRMGHVSPAALTFTPQNWQAPQTVTVTGASNCAPDGNKNYQVLVGKVMSVDPHYMGLQVPVEISVSDNDRNTATTNNAQIYICNYKVISTTKIDSVTWEYVMRAELTNSGADVGGATAVLSRKLSGTTVVDGQLLFGAAGSGDTVRASDTFIFRSPSQISPFNLEMGNSFGWDITLH